MPELSQDCQDDDSQPQPAERQDMPGRVLDPPDMFHVPHSSRQEAAERRADDALSDWGSAALRRSHSDKDGF